MSAKVVVYGNGLLTEQVCRELSGEYGLIRAGIDAETDPVDADIGLVLDDGWHPRMQETAEAAMRQAGIPWLRGFASFGEYVIGPFARPGLKGCPRCADWRRLMAGGDRKEMWTLQQRAADAGGIGPDAWCSRSGLRQTALLLAAITREALNGCGSALPQQHLLLVNLQTLSVSRHFFLPDPLCPVCGGLPDDSPSAAVGSLQPSLKVHPGSYRSRSMDELKPLLSRDYLDYRTGFLNGTMRDLVSPFADVSVNLPLFGGDEATAGRTHSYEVSEATAILEGLERYCGMSPRGKRTVVRGSYRKLEKDALNPTRVGLHAQEQYDKPGFPFQPFDADRPLDWVWGYSFLQLRPILVPELLAYYSMGCGSGFVYESSNGCALGGSLEEAVFYGILEVVERDAFLMTWYARLPLPQLDPHAAGDPELTLMLDRLQTVSGYETLLFNATMEHGIPSIWAMAKNKKSRGVNLVCAAGAHLDPVRAVKSAVHELAGMLMTLGDKFEAQRDEYARMLDDPSRVRHMEDHSMLYALPQAEPRLGFLLEGSGRRAPQTFREAFGPQSKHADLTEDLKEWMEVFRRLGLEIIVVDQSTPETLRNGLYCVKVLIPGMLPMTFGHHLTRLAGLDRVLRVPAQLGFAEKPLKPEELNPHPHPFP
ncbi:bacteriocin biosynthesis protein SagD [Paenibacillus darwinianus]|uniref:Bacteriocin biosynthesis protein SagD n=1 Tax=Paenibacillus darwinianus TaxID=1380763 RepID=A0A9W5S0I3_9BACL|nr:TOMM precursor leader peptide-binding protein [Paenibacillus darwinianus]EXX84781.1 bacteriocin biosynthesis protein SagD [Paenibacillus darwinianus]EXX88490.1 bacteriocin biosynthesis protein SagD [Paenibacillus darwinianus]EXX88702.1 bacteriocin biosynthesis protein SagD [Paenibacillus darwinianus]